MLFPAQVIQTIMESAVEKCARIGMCAEFETEKETRAVASDAMLSMRNRERSSRSCDSNALNDDVIRDCFSLCAFSISASVFSNILYTK